jgi:cytochrome c biogenesis protein CcmG/thiol:disulfide interchange protein DsbE
VSRWLATLPLVALVAVGALFYFFALKRESTEYQPQALVGKPVPDLVLPTLADGTSVRIREVAADGPVIVNFFASWCAPCQIEHPVLMGLKGRGVRVVGIAYKDKPPQSQAFLARLGDPFATVLVDLDGRAGVEFGVTGVPETFVVDRDGTVLAKHTGPLAEADAQRLEKLAR